MTEKEQILVVDDDLNLLRATSRILRAAGYEILSASTGLEGLNLAQTHIPNLILLDVILPDVSGIEICQQIKADEKLSNCPVFLLSSMQIDSESQALGLESGADGYIARPISNRELLARIESMLRLVEAEKALALKSRELERSNAELKRSNAELEQFAYAASHDLQEPLRAVTGMLRLLEQRYQGKLDERADEYIGHAVEASKRMQNLINDLLAYSRVDRGSKQLVQTDVQKVLDAALANLSVATRECNASITYESLPTIMTDPTLLTQVFQNLIGNAIKFRGERAPEIHIGAQELDNAWCFEVRDNGIGIEPQYHQRIFKIFQRLHGRREYPGTGIGLSLCQKIVESWGGRIWVESEEGQGSRFFFTIPYRR